MNIYRRSMDASQRKSLLYKIWLIIKRWCGERLTLPGKVVMLAAVTTCLAGAFPEHTHGSFGFSLFAAMILLSLATSVMRVPRVQLQRVMPERCIAGAVVPLKIIATSTSKEDISDIGAYEFRLPAGLSLIDPPRYAAVLSPGKPETFTYQLATTKRGAFHLQGPTAISPFPYGLTQSTRFQPQPQRLIVYPVFHPLVTLNVPVGARHQPGGIAMLSQVGESMEFMGTREYRAGDRIRDIHQRTWARVGFPVVKQFQEEMLTRVAIILDTFIPPDGSPRALEAALSMTAAVADHLAAQDYVVDFFAAGPELFNLQTGRSLGYLDNILDILACIEPSTEDPLSVIAPKFAEQIAQTSTVIAVLLSWDAQRQRMVSALESQGMRVKPIIVSDLLKGVDLVGGGPYAAAVTPEEVEKGIPAI
jgi:uncharacterized protein (DUF58 family)